MLASRRLGQQLWPARPARMATTASVGSQRRRYNVAVVGSGPAGFYTAKYLFKQVAATEKKLKVDMFERLPVPFGLVRFGVAPDHPEVKNVRNDFTEVAGTPGFRFFGNVEIGADVSISDLRHAYDAVVVCTGAEGERMLNIPGEDSDGVVGSPPFVKWYNAHPDYVDLELKDPGDTAVVLGQGNVAVDVARILTCSPAKLHPTDIHGPALDRIAKWQQQGLRTVHMVGRRGFVQAAFTNAELRELLNFDDEVLTVVDPAELELCRNAASETELAKSRAKKRSVSILDKMAANFAQKDTTSKRILWLRFLWSPTKVLTGDDGVSGIRLVRNELTGEPGKQSAAKASSGEEEELQCGMVVRSVGFDLTPFEGLPMENGRVHHQHGRVIAPEAEAGGLYVSGWAKRGPQGIIASNIGDAQETSQMVLRDLMDGRGDSSEAAVAAIEEQLAATGKRLVSFEDWRRIEAEEHRLGESAGRAAVKLTDIPAMLRLLDA